MVVSRLTRSAGLRASIRRPFSRDCGIQFKGGQTRPDRTAVTPERENTTVVLKAVPAEIRGNRGGASLAEEASRQILAAAELAARSGVQVDVREFVGARGKETRLAAGP